MIVYQDSQVPQAGAVVARKYRVDGYLGTGGMGIVLAGTHLALAKRVAIKVLRPGAVPRPLAEERFTLEVRMAAALRDEHVVRIYDVGQLDDGQPYMAMELLAGSDLDELVACRGRLPLEEAANYTLQACVALAEAHSLGMVHRDVKLANLFLAQQPDGRACIKVLDFGVGKPGPSGPREPEVPLLPPGVVGSPAYMPPEQVRNPRSVDHRADVWSLAVCLYRLLTDRLPFEGATPLQRMARVLHMAPVPIRTYRPELPVELEHLLTWCFAKSPEDRCPSVAALAGALASYTTVGSTAYLARIAKYLGVREASLPPSIKLREGGDATAEQAPVNSAMAAQMADEPVDPRGTLRGMTISRAGPDTASLPPEGDEHVVSAPLKEGRAGALRRWQRMLLAATCVGLGGLFACFIFMSNHQYEVVSGQVSVAAVSPEAREVGTGALDLMRLEKPKLATQTPEISLQLNISPPHAQVLLDGVVHEGRDLKLERSALPYRLLVRAAGYVPVRKKLLADTPRSLRIDLKSQPR